MFAVGIIFSITASEPSSASQAASPLSGLKKSDSSTTALMLVETLVATDTKSKVLACNLHQRSRAGSPEEWAAVSPGISN